MATMNKRIHILKENTDIISFVQNLASNSDLEKGFIVFNIGDVVQRYQEWTSLLPRVTPYFAVKSNDNHLVLKTLSALGAGFDCSSKLEIDKVLELGVSTDRIIFAHTAKVISHIRHAASCNISMMTFDGVQELHKIKTCHSSSKLLLRIRCDDETANAKLGLKFGCDPDTEAPELLKVARDLDLNVIGVSFHVGAGCGNPNIFHTAISWARKIFNLAKSFGYNFDILDIGGGYAGASRGSLKLFANVINDALEEYFPDPKIKIIAEPGTFMVSTCGTIATNIHSVRTLKEHDDAGNISLHNMYYLNDGYYGSFNCWVTHNCPFDSITPLKNNKCSVVLKSTIWGPTCDNKDKICEIMLPQMNIGDWIIFHNMGDYTSKASEFNGFSRPDMYFVVTESIWKLLKDTSLFITNDLISVDASV